MKEVSVSIVGGSGYTGGELLRLLHFHPHVRLQQITSEKNRGRPVGRVHPNLRKVSGLKFCGLAELEEADHLFLCLPHGEALQKIDFFRERAGSIIDLSGDFRLRHPAEYQRWYGREHPRADLLREAVYGIPELHRERMRGAAFVSSAGCNATAVILALYPLFKKGLIEETSTVAEVKAGSSQAGASPAPGSHHPDRSGAIRAYKPFGHRHLGEMYQELAFGRRIGIHFSATGIDMVRGIHAVCHTFLKDDLTEKDIWKMYREAYGREPFIRIIKEQSGFHRLPDPRILAGSNFCDIGFVRDKDSRRLIVYSALDNLMKGAAGQAVQAFNIMRGWRETLGLDFPGLYPV